MNTDQVVANQTFVTVRKFGNDSTRYTCDVTAIGHDCDIAMLSVHDESFYDGILPLQFGHLPVCTSISIHLL